MAEHRLMTDAEYAEMEERRNKTFDRIFAVLDTLLQRQGLPPVSSHGVENSSKEISSSSRGVMNSCQETVQQPLHSNYIFPVVESSREINLRTAELSREIKQSYTRMINLLQEEIDASESAKDSLPTLNKNFSVVEPIERHSITGEDYVGLTITTETADALLVPTVLHPSTEQLQKVQVTQISESSNNPISYVINVQATDQKKLEDDVVIIPLLHDATHYFTTHALTIHNFPYDPGSFDTPAAIPKVSNPRDSLLFEQEVMSQTLSHFDKEIHPQTITILWKTNCARVATGSLLIPTSLCPIVIHMLSAGGYFGYGTCAIDASNNYMSSCEAHNVFVKMPLKTNFSWGPLTSLLIRMHIHVFFIQDDMVPWIHVLLCVSVHSKVVPARCWMKSSENADYAWAVLSHGSVPVLQSNFHIVIRLQSVSQSFNPRADYFSVVDLSSTKYTICMVKFSICSGSLVYRQKGVGFIHIVNISNMGLPSDYGQFGFFDLFHHTLNPITTPFPSRKICVVPICAHIVASLIKDICTCLGIKVFDCVHMMPTYELHFATTIFISVHFDLSEASLYVEEFITCVIKGDSDDTVHTKLIVDPMVIILPIEKLEASISFFLPLLNSMLMLDCRGKKKSSVGNDHFYVHRNMYASLIRKVSNIKYHVNTNPTSLLVYVGSYIQDLLVVFEEFSWVSYSDQVALARMCPEVNMNSALYLIVDWFYQNFWFLSLSIFEQIQYQGFPSQVPNDGRESDINNWCGLCSRFMSCGDWYAMMGQLESSLLFSAVDFGLRFGGSTLRTLNEAMKDIQYQGSIIAKKCFMVPFVTVAYFDENIYNEILHCSHTKGCCYFKQWDPGGNGYFFYTEWSLQFHQWDPGGCSLVHGKVHLTWKQRKEITITQQTLSQP
jgi:hypothetical protein